MYTLYNLRDEVIDSLSDSEGDYHIDGIVYEIANAYDITGVQPRQDWGDVTNFWEIVEKHDLSDTARRRVALATWMLNHPELPEPYQEHYDDADGEVIFHYAYPGRKELAALYRAFEYSEGDFPDFDPVEFSENRDELIMCGRVEHRRVRALVDLSRAGDEFQFRLRASENPGRYLEIIGALTAAS